MFKLNFKIALRNIWKHKLTTSIKLFGLVVGLGTVVLLVTYIMFERSYDRHNQHADQIFRLQAISTNGQNESLSLPSGLGKTLVEEIPQITNATQFSARERNIQIDDKFFKTDALETENAFFSMFTAPLIDGDIKEVLKAPNSVVISERFAKKAFLNENPMGKSITVVNDPKPYQVVGIMKDLPKASHFKADVIFDSQLKQPLNWRAYSGIPQYIQLKEGISPIEVEQKIRSLYGKYQFPEKIEITLMPLTKIHLYSHANGEFEANSDIKYIYIFSIVAGFILLIAIVNFINLTVAASLKRGKEIGVKKVLGASAGQLRMQFLSESYLYFIVASLFVLILTYDLLPLILAKVGIDISLASILSVKTTFIAIGIVIVSGFVAGLYPAIILSRLMPVKTLKGETVRASGNFSLRKVLMTFQFSISAFLIVCTLVIYAQLQFIRHKNLGFDKNQVLVSSFNMFDENFASFKAELSGNKNVKDISISSFNPGTSYGGSSSWTNNNDTTKYEMDFIYADVNFLKTLDIHVVKGRAFSAIDAGVLNTEISNNDDPSLLLLNEEAVRLLNIRNPVDTVLNYGGLQGRVIGVVRNFNGMSLHEPVKPLVITLENDKTAGFLYVKINGSDVASGRKSVEAVWKKYFPNIPADLQFMDEHLEKLYQAEIRLGSVFVSFALIAVFLCCIGLFGMVYFDMENKTKELAVRKILGASVKDLLTMLNSSFLKVVLIANVIIWPAAYYLIREWLNGFYYRIDISYFPFIIALALCVMLTLLTVSLQALRTIKKSPVEALKYE